MKKRGGIKYRGQERKSVDRHRLLDEYYRLKKALGKKPIYAEYLAATKIKLKTMSALFGKPGWLNLVKEAGDNRTNGGRWVAHKPDAARRRLLLDSYTDLKENLGRQPSLAGYGRAEFNELRARLSGILLFGAARGRWLRFWHVRRCHREYDIFRLGDGILRRL